MTVLSKVLCTLRRGELCLRRFSTKEMLPSRSFNAVVPDLPLWLCHMMNRRKAMLARSAPAIPQPIARTQHVKRWPSEDVRVVP